MVHEQRLKMAMTEQNGQQKEVVVLTGGDCKAIHDELVRRRKLIEGFEAVLGLDSEHSKNIQD